MSGSSRLLIYLSFLSFPSADELGLLQLTYVYFGLTLLTTILLLSSNANRKVYPDAAAAVESGYYLVFLLCLLPLNFAVAQFNGVISSVWLSRSIHLALVPCFYLCFVLSGVKVETLIKDFFLVGLIEALSILLAFGFYFDALEFRRAADFEGVILYSSFMVCAAFYAIERFEVARRRSYLVIYAIILIAGVLTGTRALMIALLIPMLRLSLRPATVGLLLVLSLPLVFFAVSGLFDRFDLSQDDNLITITSKLEEIQILFNFFLDSPLIGVGMGKAYQVSVALNEYTYSHNIFLFYLGYAGAFGAVIGLYPLLRLALVRQYCWLAIALAAYYVSSTTFTNVKHSMLWAFALMVIEREYAARRAADRLSKTISMRAVSRAA
jgi:hypothetical protein